MKYWDPEFVETRDTYNGEFRSPITAPAIHGKVLSTEDKVLGLYEWEIVKEPCTVMKRIDTTALDAENAEVEDMCVLFEYRLKHPNKSMGGLTHTSTAPIPIAELTNELYNILADNELVPKERS